MSADWTSLPHHLLDLIFEKIASPVDYLQVGTACVSWHSVAQGNRDKLNLSSSHAFSPKGSVRFSGSSKGCLATVNDDYSVTLHICFFSNIDHDHTHVIAPSICLPSLFPPQLDHAQIQVNLNLAMIFLSCE